MKNFNFKPKPIPLYVWSCRKSYYLTHPWKWFRDLKVGLKNAFHRMRYGFAWVDLWNLDSYICTLLPQMLWALRDRSCAYPGTDELPTPEAYSEWLNALATIINLYNTDWIYEEEDWSKAQEALRAIPDSEYEVVRKLKADALEALGESYDKEVSWTHQVAQVGFKEFARKLPLLWD